jgi:hypothetical protein
VRSTIYINDVLLFVDAKGANIINWLAPRTHLGDEYLFVCPSVLVSREGHSRRRRANLRLFGNGLNIKQRGHVLT